MKRVSEENFEASLDASKGHLSLKGILRLSGAAEYAPISELLDELLDIEVSDILIDISGLEFLNSSGIAMLSKFMINARKKAEGTITVKGSLTVPWQTKSLKNLKRLLPSLILDIN